MSGLSYAFAVLVGVVEVALLIWSLSAAARHTHRHRYRPVPSPSTAAASSGRRLAWHPAGTHEQILARLRLAGRIDTATYQARMADLVRGAQ
ncbi:hypothetical protein [Mycobacteroides abscessus]|uniref:SHOCT domain-containing protein n=1 Tax=Mycobacteroides abscessus subsp. massiliense TaxID=1962118 RepID=A0A1T9U971_9MYCO|nr:hypothetical protein [Mycobacteroides abscessus]AMU66340.1 hypothetical protein A3O04_14435 [Mycobacteroides abscessus]ANO13425.1 hypothetical protein BAB77_05740 [Mycobacteroides abscessus]ARQ65170.1 hypothetical protein CAK77_14450 [Mycobacteroides abscessus subsp. massiliense]EHM18317.1 hypothetical protein MMAS_27760 [Mycobacteroides abscessus subsp. massiliense CCUG 48898 = JCM 15300]EIV64003.1 hypothetical protein MMCCUG48898_2908 [Mycobacteroides abscessus subsp. massiliense CCUG 488